MSNFKIILLFLFIPAFGFVACSKGDSSKAASSSRQSAISGKVMSQEHVLKGDNTPQDSKEILRSLEIAHQIFREAWVKVSDKNSSTVVSPFSELRMKLLAFEDKSVGWKSNYNASEPCHAGDVKLSIKKNVSTESTVKVDLKNQKANSLNSTGQGYKLYLVKAECRDTAKPYSTIAEINYRVDGLDIRMSHAQMPNGFGPMLAILGKIATCSITFGSNRNLETLKCTNLGQNQSSEVHYLFTSFEYIKDGEKTLHVQADRYELNQKTCESDKPCVDVLVPLAGKIRVTENLIRAESREVYERELAKVTEEQKRLNMMADQQKKAQLQQAKLDSGAVRSGNPTGFKTPSPRAQQASRPVTSVGPRASDAVDPIGPGVDSAADLSLRDPVHGGPMRKNPLTEQEVRERNGLTPDQELTPEMTGESVEQSNAQPKVDSVQEDRQPLDEEQSGNPDLRER